MALTLHLEWFYGFRKGARTVEMKQKWNSVLFLFHFIWRRKHWNKNAKTAVKRFSCFSPCSFISVLRALQRSWTPWLLECCYFSALFIRALIANFPPTYLYPALSISQYLWPTPRLWNTLPSDSLFLDVISTLITFSLLPPSQLSLPSLLVGIWVATHWLRVRRPLWQTTA